MNRYDHWKRKVKSAATVDELRYLWRNNLGDSLKDDPDIIEIFQNRSDEITKQD